MIKLVNHPIIQPANQAANQLINHFMPNLILITNLFLDLALGHRSKGSAAAVAMTCAQTYARDERLPAAGRPPVLRG